MAADLDDYIPLSSPEHSLPPPPPLPLLADFIPLIWPNHSSPPPPPPIFSSDDDDFIPLDSPELSPLPPLPAQAKKERGRDAIERGDRRSTLRRPPYPHHFGYRAPPSYFDRSRLRWGDDRRGDTWQREPPLGFDSDYRRRENNVMERKDQENWWQRSLTQPDNPHYDLRNWLLAKSRNSWRDGRRLNTWHCTRRNFDSDDRVERRKTWRARSDSVQPLRQGRISFKQFVPRLDDNILPADTESRKERHHSARVFQRINREMNSVSSEMTRLIKLAARRGIIVHRRNHLMIFQSSVAV